MRVRRRGRTKHQVGEHGKMVGRIPAVPVGRDGAGALGLKAAHQYPVDPTIGHAGEIVERAVRAAGRRRRDTDIGEPLGEQRVNRTIRRHIEITDQHHGGVCGKSGDPGRDEPASPSSAR